MPSETLVNLQPLADDKQPKISKKGKRQKSHRKLKVHQCDTCGKTFNRREYLTQHIRIHTGKLLFVLLLNNPSLLTIILTIPSVHKI